jgi:hypothetical protein
MCRSDTSLQVLMQLIVIISSYLYNEPFVVLTAVVEFVWLRMCVCVCVCVCVSFQELRT